MQTLTFHPTPARKRCQLWLRTGPSFCYSSEVITPSHIIYNLAILRNTSRKNGQKDQSAPIVLGALVPDALTYLFFLVTTFILGYSQREIWDNLYFDSAWTPFINMTHSLWIWPLAALLFYIWHKRWAMYFALSATIHICFDFFVHTDDAYAHFAPFTDWRLNTGISYWNPAEYGNIVGFLDCIIILGLLVWLYRTTENKYVRWAFISLGIVYIGFLGLTTFQMYG